MLRNMEQGIPGANRIVASTGASLTELVARQRFREDLRDRLNVVRLGLPPLRKRRGDIPLLVAHFVDRLSAAEGLARVEFPPADIEALGRYHWPDYPLDWTLEQVKRHHMACVLEACDGNKSAAARRLDISRKTLDRKLGAFGRE